MGQIANLMRIFTEFRNHVNFLVLGMILINFRFARISNSFQLHSFILIPIDFRNVDVLAQVSVMASFFWLSSLGYFVWKTFRSRNVFLRVTDGKKYCWYSFYAWGSTVCMASLATIAHIFLDISLPKRGFQDQHVAEQESIGRINSQPMCHFQRSLSNSK